MLSAEFAAYTNDHQCPVLISNTFILTSSVGWAEAYDACVEAATRAQATCLCLTLAAASPSSLPSSSLE